MNATGGSVSEIFIRAETEQIEVTRDGTLPPFQADYQRKFIPGLTTVYVTVDGEELPPMSPDAFEDWKTKKWVKQARWRAERSQDTRPE